MNIAVYQDDLHIASQTPEAILNILQDKKRSISIQIVTYQVLYPHDPGGTMICQLRKYLEKLYVNATIIFNDQLLTDLQISLKIIKLLITKGNPNLIHNETRYAPKSLIKKKKIEQTIQ